MNAPASFLWLARHELRLAWRDVAHMTAGGRPGRTRKIAVVAIFFLAGLHVMAFLALRHAGANFHADLPTLVTVTATLLLSGSAMLSQAIESVTRTFYSRSDLELILSSPARVSRLFAVRIGAIALSGSLMSLFLFGPFVNVLVWQSGWRWLGAYGVIIAVSAVATALGTLLTISLFQAMGPKRTRLIAQLLAGVIGGAFVIGLQLAGMFSTGTASRMSFLQSQTVMRHVPGVHSVLWWPARAALGDEMMVAVVMAAALALLLATIVTYAPRFADYAITARSTSERRSTASERNRALSVRTAPSTLRRKERILLLRDPWLISQSFMQLLYLLPPAVLLWHTFSFHGQAAILLIPVLIMAAGQLAGALAWLTISGEDAPDLILTAPIPQSHIWRAKVEAVMQCIALVFSPFVLGLLLISPRLAAISVAGIAASGMSSAVIQLWFRSQAKRSQFRRRHTSSRIATFSEAFSSITWSAAGGIAAVSSWVGGIVAVMAIGLLAAVRLLSPARSQPASI
jgi:ABC-2 type transport system permease protein